MASLVLFVTVSVAVTTISYVPAAVVLVIDIFLVVLFKVAPVGAPLFIV